MPQNIAPPGLISLLAAALAQQPTKPLVLALDGRCGSGKTTLANTLARQFPASITLHTDDFYLPPAGAGGRAICQFCRPVGAAGGGLFCPVPHCGDGRFCGRHHPKRDDLKWLPRRSSHYQRKDHL